VERDSRDWDVETTASVAGSKSSPEIGKAALSLFRERAAQNHFPDIDAMRDASLKENRKPIRWLPTRLIITVAAVLGLAILGIAQFLALLF